MKSISLSEKEDSAQGCPPIRGTITGQRVMAELPKRKNMLNLSSQAEWQLRERPLSQEKDRPDWFLTQRQKITPLFHQRYPFCCVEMESCNVSTLLFVLNSFKFLTLSNALHTISQFTHIVLPRTSVPGSPWPQDGPQCTPQELHHLLLWRLALAN